MSPEIAAVEKQIFELKRTLTELRRNNPPDEVPNYTFEALHGPVTLLDLFGSKDRLLAIHNMGQGCRYCTLWADGFNGFVPHLESVMSVVLLSKDTPGTQRRFANSRGWRFSLASHGGGNYIREQTVLEDQENMPGAVLYERSGQRILRKNACIFGPGDIYCSMWSLLGLAGLDAEAWTPQFHYWTRPRQMDDGGQNLVE